MNLKLKIKFIIMFLIIVLIIPFSCVFAEGNNSSNASYDIPIFKDDQKLNLPKNVGAYWFALPKGFDLGDDCSVQLHFTFSNTLISTRSNITMLINDYPVETQWTYDIQKATSGWWNVKFPTSKLRIDGINEIKFQSNQRSIEGDCADMDNPSNWVVFHKDSKLHVTVNKYPDPLLSNFHVIYYDNFLRDNVLSSNFILPKNVDDNCTTELLKICSSIGKVSTDKDNIDYGVFKEGDTYAEKNKVFVGLYSAFTNISKFFNPVDNKLSKDEGYLSITQENGNIYNTLVTGQSKAGLNKAVDFMSDDSLLNQVASNSIKINSNLKYTSSVKPVNTNGIYKFSDFGYSDVNLQGAFHQKVDMSFIQPKGVQSQKGSYINLKFKHSKVLDSDRSCITVYIDGMAVNSTKLTVANAEDGTLKINIPDSALNLPEIKVSIECYNYLGKIDCSKDYYDSAWTVINSDSQICLLSEEKSIEPNLQKFPFFYTNYSNNDNQVAIGMWNTSNLFNLKIASILATRIGQNTGEAFNWDLIGKNAELTDKQKAMNMVFIGTYDGIEIPETIKKQLAVSPSKNGNFDIKKEVNLIPEVLKNKVLFQVVRSPWDTSKRVYVILCDDNIISLQLLEDALSDRNILSKLDGQVTLIDTNKKIQNINVKETGSVKVTKTLWEEIRYAEFKTHIPWWMLMIILIVIIVGIIAIICLHRSKNEFKKKSEKLKKQEGFFYEDIEENEETKNNKDPLE